MTNLEMMQNQLIQVFQYSEMLVRLNSVQELLDLKGYCGEAELNTFIEELKIKVRKQMEIHLNNSQVSDRAKIIVNNVEILRRLNASR